MKKIGKEPSDENNDDNDDDLLTEINMGKTEALDIRSLEMINTHVPK